MARAARLSRRGLLVGGASLLGAGAFVECESLEGRFDHRRSPGTFGGSRYGDSLAALERAGAKGVARASIEVIVLAPWEAHTMKDVTITAVPGLHDIYEVGFIVQGGGTFVYFAGDSQIHRALPAIAERFAPEVSILSCDGTKRCVVPVPGELVAI